MITIDRRSGSGELITRFPEGLARVGDLEYGDMSFIGNGPDGFPVAVGVERKEIHDLVNSMRSGRLVEHQAPGMVRVYGERYLVVEGYWRPNPATGMLQILTRGRWRDLHYGKFTATGVWGFLNSLSIMAGFRIGHTTNQMETVRLVCAWYRWWQKEWHEHGIVIGHSPSMLQGASLTPPSLKRRIAAQLPGIGSKRSAVVARHFRNSVVMIDASEEEWTRVEGIGKVTAKRVYDELRKYD